MGLEIKSAPIRLSRYSSAFIIFSLLLILFGSILYQRDYELANYTVEAAYIMLIIGILNELAERYGLKN